MSETGTSGTCADGVALDPRGVAVSPLGDHVYVGSEDSDAVAAFSRNAATGKLTQLAGTDACVSETGTSGTCADGVALDAPSGVAVSPDGKNVYVASVLSHAVAAFSRNAATGKLTQLAGADACVEQTGTGTICADGVALTRASVVVVSPDGKNVYVTSWFSDAVAVFSRDATTGKLTQLAGTDACVSEDGTSGACADGVGLDVAAVVVVSPDGKHVYVASESDVVAAFSRDATTGKLTQLAGTDACVAETVAGATAGCADGVALDGAFGVVVSPDGKHVYVASENSDAVAAFTRDATTGKLTQLTGTDACVAETVAGATAGCADGAALDFVRGLVVSPDGEHAYVGSLTSDAVAAFTRDSTTGRLTQLTGTDACVAETVAGATAGCADGVALDGAYNVAISPDGNHVYVGSPDSDAVAAFKRTVPPPPPAGTTYFPLTVTKTGMGSGHVVSDPQLEIDCGDRCSSSITAQYIGWLEATADADSVFSGWGGDCVEVEGNRCKVHMNSAISVSAAFTLEEPEPSPEPSPDPTPDPEPERFDVSLSLELVKRHGSLVARGGVSSDEPSCMQGVTVEVVRLRGGNEIPKGSDVTSATGRYRLRLDAREGTYVATADAHTPAELIECLAGESASHTRELDLRAGPRKAPRPLLFQLLSHATGPKVLI